MACGVWRFALPPPDGKLHGPAAAPSGAEDPPLLLRHSIFTRIYFAIENEFAFFHFKRPGVTLSGRAFFRLLISGADFIGHFLDRIIFLPICNELFLHADLYRHRYPPSSPREQSRPARPRPLPPRVFPPSPAGESRGLRRRLPRYDLHGQPFGSPQQIEAYQAPDIHLREKTVEVGAALPGKAVTRRQ